MTQHLDAMPSLSTVYRAVLGLGRKRTGELDAIVSGIGVDATRLASYRDVCGFAGSAVAGVPATYPHVQAFPLQLWVMTRDGFPFPVLGCVYLANTITQHRPLSVDDRLDLRVYSTQVEPHPRGRQLTIVTEASCAGDVVWSGTTDLLHREQASGGDPAPQAAGLPEDAPTGPISWRLPSSLGRRYASVSGDRNLIHLTDLTARPFGFKHHIAHGMWTVARSLAELAPRLPAAFDLSVAFKRPIPLPGTVTFGARDQESRLEFGVSSANGTHLVGAITPRQVTSDDATGHDR